MQTNGDERIAGLDGLRAVAIAIVLVGHFAPAPLRGYVPDAPLGVDLFFGISGFIITTLLLAEHHRTGHIDITRFYGRRAIRILPPFAAMLAVTGLLAANGVLEVARADWLASLTLTRNFWGGPPSPLSHIWSLSVEEQFYLIFPVVVSRMGAAGARGFACGAIAGLPLLRRAGAIPLPGTGLLEDLAQDFLIDRVAWGVLLATVVRDTRVQAALAGVRYGWAALGAVAIALLFRRGDLPGSRPMVMLAVTLVIWWAIHDRQSPMGRLLGARPVVWLGAASYSVYLWQQMFIPSGRLDLALLTGAASYYLLDQPLKRWRSRLRESSPMRA